MDDLSFRAEFHRALDPLAPPAPWLASHVQEGLRSKRQQRAAAARSEGWRGTVLPRLSMALLASVLIVVVAATAVATFVFVHDYFHKTVPIRVHTGPVTRMCNQGGLYMVDKQVGWQGTRRTTDGGITWRDVTPNPDPSSNISVGQTTCILDASHAWVVGSTGPAAKGAHPDHVVVLASSDGGSTWQQSQPFPVSGDFAAEVDFLDAQHGWLLTDTTTFSTPPVRSLWATSDGGIHWSLVAKGGQNDKVGLGSMAKGCLANGITFISASRGWLTWNCVGAVAATSDGGRSWSAVSTLASSAFSCVPSPPVFSGKEGVIQMSCVAGSEVFSTNDTGQTLTPGGGVMPVSNMAGADFVDAITGFIFHEDRGAKGQVTGNDLYRTDDGGRRWTVVAKSAFPGQTVQSYAFLDGASGFINLSGSPAFWRTTDGGKTWVLPAPYRAVGSVVCPLPANVGPAGAPTPVKMVDATTGWAAGALRTTDGGAHWKSVLPPPSADRSSGYSEYFLDATHAWVAQTAGTSTACADHVTVFATADSGATWQLAAQVRPKLPNPQLTMSGDWQPELDFIDGQHGWMLVVDTTPQPFMMRVDLSPAPVAVSQGWMPLYRTTDGGRHWTLVTALAGQAQGCAGRGPISFSSATTGWMRAQCANGGLVVTHDGGVTWAVQAVGSGGCCQIGQPIFFDEAHGVLTDSGFSVLFVTSDGGRTWTQRALPPLPYFTCQGKGGTSTQCTNDSVMGVSFVDPNRGLAVIARFDPLGIRLSWRMGMTSDGGKTWSEFRANLPVISAGTDLSGARLFLVDPGHAFWWEGGRALFRSADGGHTWTAVQMTVG